MVTRIEEHDGMQEMANSSDVLMQSSIKFRPPKPPRPNHDLPGAHIDVIIIVLIVL
jgi:hypothetical protein